jgi:hypothetical protein
MDNIFINNSHKSRYIEMLATADVHKYDQERKALFYIISGNDDLYLKKKEIYNFFETQLSLNVSNRIRLTFVHPLRLCYVWGSPLQRLL